MHCINISYPEILRLYGALGWQRCSYVREKIDALLSKESVSAFLVQGSFSREQTDELSDLDVIVVVEDNAFDYQIAELRKMFKEDQSIAIHAHTDRFPWFGHLEAAIYPGSNWFSIEIGFVQHSKFEKFYVEPDVWIIKDSDGAALKRRDACLVEKIASTKMEMNNLCYELFNLGIKFEKAIKRKHLWNAHNYCSIARRILFDIERRNKYGVEKVFVGTPERRIESEIDSCIIRGLDKSAPGYCIEELTSAFLFLFDEIFTRTRGNINNQSLQWLIRWRRNAIKLYGR